MTRDRIQAALDALGVLLDSGATIPGPLSNQDDTLHAGWLKAKAIAEVLIPTVTMTLDASIPSGPGRFTVAATGDANPDSFNGRVPCGGDWAIDVSVTPPDPDLYPEWHGGVSIDAPSLDGVFDLSDTIGTSGGGTASWGNTYYAQIAGGGSGAVVPYMDVPAGVVTVVVTQTSMPAFEHNPSTPATNVQEAMDQLFVAIAVAHSFHLL